MSEEVRRVHCIPQKQWEELQAELNYLRQRDELLTALEAAAVECREGMQRAEYASVISSVN